MVIYIRHLNLVHKSSSSFLYLSFVSLENVQYTKSKRTCSLITCQWQSTICMASLLALPALPYDPNFYFGAFLEAICVQSGPDCHGGGSRYAMMCFASIDNVGRSAS